MEIKKVNKEKELANGNKVIQAEGAILAQVCPPPLKTLKLMPPASSKKRKAMSKMIDTGNLPSCQGQKRHKVDLSIPSKTPVIELDPAILPATPIASFVAPKANIPTPFPDIGPLSIPPSTALLEGSPLTLLKSKTLAWNKLKQVVKDKDVNICYDMSVKEFECSIVHDLFKVTFFIHNHSRIILLYHILTQITCYHFVLCVVGYV